MANGHRLDDRALTAALRSYDFGKRYRVTNLATGKSVVVTHTDYGPSPRLKDRVIDLSQAAFSAIEDLRHGVCNVTVEPL